MAHGPAPVPIDQRFVTQRLATAEGALGEALAHLHEDALSPGARPSATREVERAAARVRYWRDLRRRDSTHPRVRACRLLGHSWVTSSVDSIALEICRRCGALRVD